MKLLSFTVGSRESYGIALEDGILDLGLRLGPDRATLRDLLAAGALAEARDLMESCTPDLTYGQITYRPPVPAPEKIFCIGVNYPERHEEYGDASERPLYPSVFMRTPGSLVGHRQPLVRPPESDAFDYEGELAVIIGRSGRRIPEGLADTFIAGVTCANEGTIRDWLRHGKFNVTPGKNFDRSGAIGPWMVTLDEVGPLDRLELTTAVNGELRQRDSTGRLLFPVAWLVAYISTFSRLVPGDIIVTGTPPGAGARLTPPRFLVPGDRVDVTIARVGTLTNTVADESRRPRKSGSGPTPTPSGG
jgi:5-carboxymethyl-2-hydroxymuconate isomerase